MNSNPYRSPALVRRSGTHQLSNPALIALLQGVLAKGYRFRFHARGDSMWPFIKNDDLITLAPLSFRSPGRGDIVAFVRSQTNQLVVHRIIGIEPGGFLVQGDNDPVQGEHIAGKNLMGCVVKIERKGKTVRLGLGPARLMIPCLHRARLLGVLKAGYECLRGVFNRIHP